MISILLSLGLSIGQIPTGSGELRTSADETVVVTAIGSGTSATKSTHNAIYEALCQSLGAIVSAEAVLENDEYREKIIAYTDGFIERYEVLEQAEENGIYTTRVCALVRQAKLGAELRDWGVETDKVDGKVLAARARLITEQREIAPQLVLPAIRQLRGVVHAGLKGEWEVSDARGAQVQLKVPVEVWVDVEGYQAWLDKYIPWFEAISIAHKKQQAVPPRPSDWRQRADNLTYEDCWDVAALQEITVACKPPKKPAQLLLIRDLKGKGTWAFAFDMSGRSPILDYVFASEPSLALELLDEQGVSCSPSLTLSQIGSVRQFMPSVVGCHWVSSMYPRLGKWEAATTMITPNIATSQRNAKIWAHKWPKPRIAGDATVTLSLDSLESLTDVRLSIVWPD